MKINNLGVIHAQKQTRKEKLAMRTILQQVAAMTEKLTKAVYNGKGNNDLWIIDNWAYWTNAAFLVKFPLDHAEGCFDIKAAALGTYYQISEPKYKPGIFSQLIPSRGYDRTISPMCYPCGVSKTPKFCYIGIERGDVFIDTIRHYSLSYHVGSYLLMASKTADCLAELSLKYGMSSLYHWDDSNVHMVFFQCLPDVEIYTSLHTIKGITQDV